MLLERGERGVQLHAAVLEQGDLVDRAGLTRRIAAGEDDGSPLTGEPEQPNPLIGVKCTQRFIEKDELGVTEQRGGHGGALQEGEPHPRHGAIAAGGQPPPLDGLLDPTLCIGPLETDEPRGKGQRLVRRHPWEESRIGADVGKATGPAGRGRVGSQGARQLVAAAVRARKPGQDAQKQRSRSVGNGDQQQPRANRDLQVDALEQGLVADPPTNPLADHRRRVKQPNGLR